MKKSLLACLALCMILVLIPAANAQEDGYPACSESEFFILLSSLLDYVAADRSAVDTIADLADRAGVHLEQRDDSVSLLPLCGTAIVTQRRVLAMHGDAFAGAALERAGMSRSANPYFARDLVDEMGINRALEDLLSAADAADAPVERGDLRLCARAENDLLNALAAEFLDIDLSPDAQHDAIIAQIDRILAWRGESMARLPECAQAIELGFLWSKATTDAAALLAFRYADVPEGDNPYAQVVSRAREELSTWRKDVMIIQPRYKGATVLALGPASELPACHITIVRTTYRVLTRKVLDVVRTILNIETAADLAAYEQAHLELLESSLRPCLYAPRSSNSTGWRAECWLTAPPGPHRKCWSLRLRGIHSAAM